MVTDQGIAQKVLTLHAPICEKVTLYSTGEAVVLPSGKRGIVVELTVVLATPGP